MTRPTRIDQVIPSIIEHDAVSNHTFEAQRLLREMGFESEIYASIIGPGCAGRVRPLEQLPRQQDGSQWILYECSIGSPAAEVVARHPGTKLVDYHNITPAELVERWIPPLADEARLGRAQLIELAPVVHAAFADSAYNASELDQAGFTNTSVVPLLVHSAVYDAEPDPKKFAELTKAKESGGSDWIFVGQIAPHKAQHDIVRAFFCYRACYDPNARLHLVGREMGSTYRDALSRFIHALSLDDAVDLPGAISIPELAAYYASADAFVCCSDHEGFCAPIVEAMSRGVPVVAYKAAAVTETVGTSGILLTDKRPALVASAVYELLGQPERYKRMQTLARQRAGEYTVDRAQRAFREAILGAITSI